MKKDSFELDSIEEAIEAIKKRGSHYCCR